MVDKLIEYGVWPLAVVIIGIVAMVIFRGPVSGLLNRTKKIGAGSNAIDFAEPKTTELQQAQAQPQPPAGQIANDPLGPPSASVAELEKQIVQQLNSRNDNEEFKMRRLIRASAILALNSDFEVIYRLIFGSQLDLLLRANAGGIDEAAASLIYQNAQTAFPLVHESGSFDMWLSFPIGRGLVERKNGRISTTLKGKEFMRYLVDVGLTMPKAG